MAITETRIWEYEVNPWSGYPFVLVNFLLHNLLWLLGMITMLSVFLEVLGDDRFANETSVVHWSWERNNKSETPGENEAYDFLSRYLWCFIPRAFKEWEGKSNWTFEISLKNGDRVECDNYEYNRVFRCIYLEVIDEYSENHKFVQGF